MKKSLFALFIALALLNTHCKKETTIATEALPSADFTFDKTEYGAYETIKLTNTSTNASNFRWTLPDGTTSKTKDLIYTLGDTEDGTLIFKLDAISEKGTLSDYSTKRVNIKSGTGEVVFYSMNFYDIRNISIDNGPEFQIALDTYRNSATCGQSGCHTMTLKKGVHTVKFNPAGSSINIKTFTVTTNSCVAVGFY